MERTILMRTVWRKIDRRVKFNIQTLNPDGRGRSRMKYAECPTVTVSADVDASPGEVWALVSDIGLSSRFSTEVSGAEWLDGADGPALDARFVGHSAHG